MPVLREDNMVSVTGTGTDGQTKVLGRRIPNVASEWRDFYGLIVNQCPLPLIIRDVEGATCDGAKSVLLSLVGNDPHSWLDPVRLQDSPLALRKAFLDAGIGAPVIETPFHVQAVRAVKSSLQALRR